MDMLGTVTEQGRSSVAAPTKVLGPLPRLTATHSGRSAFDDFHLTDYMSITLHTLCKRGLYPRAFATLSAQQAIAARPSACPSAVLASVASLWRCRTRMIVKISGHGLATF